MDISDSLDGFGIFVCDGFSEEYFEASSKCKEQKAIDTKLLYCIGRMLDAPNTYFIDNCLLFESVTAHPGLYSIRLKSGGNVRVLHARVQGRFIFLHAFYEKGPKAKTDYRTHAPIADDRLTWYKAKNGGRTNGCK